MRHWCLSASLNAGSVAETHLFPLPAFFTVLIDLHGEIIGYLTRKKAELEKKTLGSSNWVGRWELSRARVGLLTPTNDG